MKKLLIFILIVLSSLGVTRLMKNASFANNSNVQVHDIIGTWAEADTKLQYNDVGFLEITDRLITFKNDGTYAYNDKVKYTTIKSPAKVMHFQRQSGGNWALKRNTITSSPNQRTVKPFNATPESLQLANEWSKDVPEGSFKEKIVDLDQTKFETWSKDFKEKRLYKRYNN